MNATSNYRFVGQVAQLVTTWAKLQHRAQLQPVALQKHQIHRVKKAAWLGSSQHQPHLLSYLCHMDSQIYQNISFREPEGISLSQIQASVFNSIFNKLLCAALHSKGNTTAAELLISNLISLLKIINNSFHKRNRWPITSIRQAKQMPKVREICSGDSKRSIQQQYKEEDEAQLPVTHNDGAMQVGVQDGCVPVCLMCASSIHAEHFPPSTSMTHW